MSKEVINVSLEGGKPLFGGREEPTTAKTISCDKKDKCSFFKQGQCAALKVYGDKCKYGEIQDYKGYTSRAKKYDTFRRKWTEHEKYKALEANKKNLGLIDGEVFFSYNHIRLKVENNRVFIYGPNMSLGSSIAYIPLNLFTVSLIKSICETQPRGVMGGIISNYQEEVHLFLGHLKELLPDLYHEFISTYKEFDKVIDYIGRKAYLHTLKPCIVHYKSKSYPKFNNAWYWDGAYLNYKEGYVGKFDIAKNYDEIELKIKPKHGEVITISDNNQVTEETVFID